MTQSNCQPLKLLSKCFIYTDYHYLIILITLHIFSTYLIQFQLKLKSFFFCYLVGYKLERNKTRKKEPAARNKYIKESDYRFDCMQNTAISSRNEPKIG